MNVGVLLLAAGSGRRFGGGLPKQYALVAGKPLLAHTLTSLAAEPRIRLVQPVIAEGDKHYAAAVAGLRFSFKLFAPVAGGAERSESMQAGFAALPDDIDFVAVHDAARPLPSPALLADVLDVAERHGAAVPGLAVHDTIKVVNAEGRVIETPSRASLRAVQTPQVARRDWFALALAQEADRLHRHTDDASLLESAGFPVHVSRGEPDNRKITTQEDMQWLQARLEGKS